MATVLQMDNESKGKRMIISQELFEEVVGVGYDSIKGDEIWYHYTCPIMGEGSIVDETISIYKFVHKCKKWAFEKGYDISSSYYRDCQVYMVSGIPIYEALFSTDTDTENKEIVDIIKACEWVLKQKESK